MAVEILAECPILVFRFVSVSAERVCRVGENVPLHGIPRIFLGTLGFLCGYGWRVPALLLLLRFWATESGTSSPVREGIIY